jgi:serine beta-lactamase-like protein LACTB
VRHTNRHGSLFKISQVTPGNLEMKKKTAALMASLGAFIGSSVAAQAQQLPSATVGQIEQLITAYMSAHRVPGLSIAVVVDGKLAWSNGYGMANLENFVPAKASTAFRSASIGKTMTATAAMQLFEQGKLDLDTDIRKYCPAFPQKRYLITSRQLLSHLSGIRHYGGPRDKEEQSSTVHYGGVVEALAPFKKDPLLFPPGTKFLYSSYGYDVLGCVIQGAAGVPFLAYMKEYVWDPAGMTATRDDDPSALIPNRAAGYVHIDGQLHNAQMVDMSNRLAAGGYVTTVVDLAKFATAVMTGQLIRDETFKQMTTPARLSNGEKVEYGQGWGLELEEWHSDRWVSHGGGSPGVSGFLALMPKHQFAVAILSNLEGLPDRSPFAANVARVVLGFGSPEKGNQP